MDTKKNIIDEIEATCPKMSRMNLGSTHLEMRKFIIDGNNITLYFVPFEMYERAISALNKAEHFISKKIS